MLSGSNLGSVEWGSRPQKIEWWQIIVRGGRQTLHKLMCTMWGVKCRLPLGQIIGYTNTSPLEETKLKTGLMASNNSSTILNQSKRGNWLTACNITSTRLFSSLLCH